MSDDLVLDENDLVAVLAAAIEQARREECEPMIPMTGQEAAKPWLVRLTCCGRDDGEYRAVTWQEADDFRESYTSGPGVSPGGHVRAGIIVRSAPESAR